MDGIEAIMAAIKHDIATNCLDRMPDTMPQIRIGGKHFLPLAVLHCSMP
jgi:hypothetical protein